MNITRIAVLGVAAISAGVAALLVRGMLGGGTPSVQAAPQPNLATVEVLVATNEIEAGRAISADNVHWQAWPKSAAGGDFITKDAHPDLAPLVAGAVVRAPLIAGQPLTETNLVHAGSAGFLAATITQGQRAVSIPVSAETGAGGFILPNDRVDVILTREVGNSGSGVFESHAILGDVRVLAIDQTPKQEKDQQSVVGKTATLELSPADAEMIAQAKATGVLSLSLRALGDNAKLAERKKAIASRHVANEVTVIRYGIARSATASGGGASSNAVSGGNITAGSTAPAPGLAAESITAATATSVKPVVVIP